jgi:hypothetical protein
VLAKPRWGESFSPSGPLAVKTGKHVETDWNVTTFAFFLSASRLYDNSEGRRRAKIWSTWWPLSVSKTYFFKYNIRLRGKRQKEYWHGCKLIAHRITTIDNSAAGHSRLDYEHEDEKASWVRPWWHTDNNG